MTTVHGPASGGEPGSGPRFVFVSYSRADSDWLPRFETMLSPVVARRGMRVWSDTLIGTGRRWRPEIDDAIARADVALLLVSPDFLTSRFIMQQELPALIARGVPLVPVLLRACRYHDVAELREVQWAHDPGREGPLAELKRRKVDGAILRVTYALMQVLDDQAPRTDADAVPTVEAARSSTLMTALVLPGSEGELDGVPDPPVGFMQRHELPELRGALLGAGGGAMALTGGQGLGLHGQGGIGKTVLAAALARDPLLHRHFPDGVYWVTLGERPDLVGAQLDLLARLGVTAGEVRTTREGVKALRQALDGRRSLIVVDDVRSAAAAQAFDVTGPQGRVLYTTRDPRALRDVRAQVRRIELLSPGNRVRVFLCHSSADKPAVRALYRRLADDGFAPWLDEEDLAPGENWELAIGKAVRAADYVVACLSNAATTRAGYVHKEIKQALDVADEQPEGSIYVIPVRLEACTVPDRLRNLHWVDLFAENGYVRLTRTLRPKDAGCVRLPGSSIPTQTRVTRR